MWVWNGNDRSPWPHFVCEVGSCLLKFFFWFLLFHFLIFFSFFEDEEHLLLICPNTQKVREHFCSTLPLTHTSTFAELMQIMNTVALAKFVACCQYQKTICPPWSTFHLMDSLVPNRRKIINNKQFPYISYYFFIFLFIFLSCISILFYFLFFFLVGTIKLINIWEFGLYNT